MTHLHRFGLLGASVAIAAVGLAAPASAVDAPPADGFYAYAEAGKPPAEWEMVSICSQASGTREQSDYSDPAIQTLGCTVNLTSLSGNRVTQDERLLTFFSRTQLSGGQWTAEIPVPNGQVCPDGRLAPLHQRFQFDAAASSGTRTVLWGDECGETPGMTKTPFTLTFVRPPDKPIDNRFPMQCDYLVGRPSICS